MSTASLHSSTRNMTEIVYQCQTDTKVEGQTAFFWLICLGLNSMTQPSGRVCDMPIEYRFILRSSPVICAVDGLGVLCLWVRHIIWHLESPITAARRIARARFRGITNRDDEESLTSLERNTPFRYIVFALGVLPVAIKSLASSGIMGIQIIGGMYLGSWTVLELVVVAHIVYDKRKKYNNVTIYPEIQDEHLKWKKSRKAWSICALAVHAIVSVYIVRTRYLDLSGRMFVDSFLYFMSLCTWVGYLFNMNMFITGDDESDELASICIMSTAHLLMEAIPILTYSFLPNRLEWDIPFLIALLLPMILWLFSFSLMGTSGWITRWLSDSRKENLKRITRTFIGAYLNLQVSIIYFVFFYDSAATNIPAWTKWLG